MIQHYKVEPANIVVLTFTNKAASEMRNRIKRLVGSVIVDSLKMGTFHSICRSYLQKYGKLIGLAPNFIIADRDDCLAIIKRALNSAAIPEQLRKELTAKHMLDQISSAKSRNVSFESWRMEAEVAHDGHFREKRFVMARVFE